MILNIHIIMMDEVGRDAVATSIAPTLPPIRDDDNGNNNDNNNGNDNDHIATQEDDEADALLVDVDDDNEETEEDDVSMQIEQMDKEDNALVEEFIEKEIERHHSQCILQTLMVIKYTKRRYYQII